MPSPIKRRHRASVDSKGPQTGPFTDAALDLYQHGLAVIPVGGDEGKVPLVKGWAKWKSPPGRDFLQKLFKRFSAANIGVITQLSGVTVVDVDDPKLVDTMVNQCGDTPLKMATPSGGVHLWYRYDGERQSIRLDGMKVDIKGAGCFVVVPPSIRPNGVHSGKHYAFLSGSWDDLRRLPKAREGSLPKYEPRINKADKNIYPFSAIKKGSRNGNLLRLLLSQAHACDGFDALLDVAHTINDDFDPPMLKAEVEKTADSAWGYEVSGNNWAGKEAQIVIKDSELHILKENPNAFTLRSVLQAFHGARQEPFAVCAKAMADAKIIPGWKWRRYAYARHWLIERGFLEVVHKGGSGTGDMWLFHLSSPVVEKGPASVPNITKHPSPRRKDLNNPEDADLSVELEKQSKSDKRR